MKGIGSILDIMPASRSLDLSRFAPLEMDVEILRAQLTVENKNHSEVRTGQTLGIISVLATAGVVIYALNLGYPVVAGIVCSTTIVGLVAAFVTGRMKAETGRNSEQP